MAGGKGERLGSGGVEKPLLEFRGRPLIAHVLAALNKSQIERVVTVTSPRTPCTTRWAREARIQVVKAPGRGYIQDYSWASKRLGLQGPVLIIAADLPLIDYRLIDRIIERGSKAESSALGVYSPTSFAMRPMYHLTSYSRQTLSCLCLRALTSSMQATSINYNKKRCLSFAMSHCCITSIEEAT